MNIITRSRRRGRDGKAIVVPLPVAYSSVPSRRRVGIRRRNGEETMTLIAKARKTPRGVVTDCARFPAAVAYRGCDWLGKRSGSGQLAVDKRPQTAMSKQAWLPCLSARRSPRPISCPSPVDRSIARPPPTMIMTMIKAISSPPSVDKRPYSPQKGKLLPGSRTPVTQCDARWDT